MKQTFCRLLLVIAFSLIVSTNFAQGSSIPGDTLLNMMLKDWARGKAYTEEYLNAMPAAKYSFKAQDSVRSFAQQMLHLAQANIFFITTATGEKPPFPRRDLENTMSAQSADSVRYFVNSSYDYVMGAIKKVDPSTLMEIKSFNMGQTITGSKLAWLYKGFEHQTHHRGQTTIYIRLVGVKPPAEKLF